MQRPKLRDNRGKEPYELDSALHAMQSLQSDMVGEAERAGLIDDDDVMELVKEMRNVGDDI